MNDFENEGNSTSKGHFAANDLLMLEYLEGNLPTGEARVIEEHLTSCPECQAACGQWQELDARLSAGLKRPSLSADFSARLWQRVEKEAQTATQLEACQPRLPFEPDFKKAWNSYRKGFLRSHIPALLDQLGYGLAAAVGAYGLFQALTRLLATTVSLQGGTTTIRGQALSVGAAALVLVFALMQPARAHFRRWLRAL